MKRRQLPYVVSRVPLAVAWMALAVLAGCPSNGTDSKQGGAENKPAAAKVKLTSPAFSPGQSIPPKYTADGDDLSPPLAWSGLPEGAKELALICDDPDAPDPDHPRAEPWVHWVVYKIPATAKELPEGIPRKTRPDEPAGIVQGNNSWPAGENVGYRGPKPPIGKHRYFFKLYVLDSELDLQPGLDKASLLEAVAGHILAEGELMGTYRKR